MTLIHSKTVFRFWMDFAAISHSTPPPRPALQLMNSIEIDFETSNVNIFQPSSRLHTLLACAKMLRSLEGNEIMRDTLRIRCPRSSFNILDSVDCLHILADPLEGLIGFQTVIVEVSSDRNFRNIETGTPSEKNACSLGSLHLHSLYTKGEDIIKIIRCILEPSLGSSSEGQMKCSEKVMYARYLEFHPREHRKKCLEREFQTLLTKAQKVLLELDHLKKLG